MRIDNAISAPKFLQHAKCYSLIVNDSELKVVHVSRGWKVNSKKQTLISPRTAHLKVAARQANENLSNATMMEYMNRKGSATIPLPELTSDLSARHDGVGILKFHGAGHSYTLLLDDTELATAREFAERLHGNIA